MDGGGGSHPLHPPPRSASGERKTPPSHQFHFPVGQVQDAPRFAFEEGRVRAKLGEELYRRQGKRGALIRTRMYWRADPNLPVISP